jgi:hypothetical protein
MKTIELFSGTGSFSKAAKDMGYGTFTIDIEKRFNPDICLDILGLDFENIERLLEDKDIVWMSPPCTTFSLASGNRHWTKDRQPKTLDARIGRDCLAIYKRIAHHCIMTDKIFFIENPNGRAVWFLPDAWLKKAWYCQYGDKRAKPTNIWTNLDIRFRTCRNENPGCHHERAKRGSKTGTQGQSGSVERGMIPRGLFDHIFEAIDRRENG